MVRTFSQDHGYDTIKPGKSLFTSKHIKSKDVLFLKYKKSKQHKKDKKNLRNTITNSAKPLLLKSIMQNNRHCLQNNGKLFFVYTVWIMQLNLKNIKMSYKSFSQSTELDRLQMCPIPNKKFFVLNFEKGVIFIIDQKFKVSWSKDIRPREPSTMIYLEGLIYFFPENNNDFIETYDLKDDKWRKNAKINLGSNGEICTCVAFEGKIIIAPYLKSNLKVFDPFCNSSSKILKLNEESLSITLFAEGDKLYCIQYMNYIFESLPRDFTQWHCIGKESFGLFINIQPHSLYSGSMYFVRAYPLALFKFNLKSKEINFVDLLCFTEKNRIN